ncbi:hypothetical protein F4782DRAFT_545484 [Xylaria castorea]|nr:hypothetical protein F4782DRAFT_545484 [Xylaria castorea]
MTEMCSFEELDQLYVSILNRLYLTCRGAKARQNSQRLFQWVYAAYRPLYVEELRFALGIKAGSATKTTQLIKRFENALLEIGQDKVVRLIHTSFLEFFAQMQETTAFPHLQCNFKVDASTAHHLVAIDCLSFLSFDAPKGSLAQLSQTHSIARAIVVRYPLLLYVTEFWVSHTTEAIRDEIVPPSQSMPANQYLHGLVLEYINNLMDNKLAVTVWIELSWFSKMPPSLHQLADLVNTSPLPNMKQLRERLGIFTSELQHLNSRWGAILQDDPGEIWQPSISAFMKPQSWISSSQATVTELDSPQVDAGQKGLGLSHDSTCILIASKSSDSGSEVGWIKVWPSKLVICLSSIIWPITAKRCRSFVDHIHLKNNPDLYKMSSEWTASYDIKRLVDGLSTHHIEVQLPENSIVGVVKKARINGGQFEFPVAFSHDLRQIAILSYLIRIHPCSTDISRQDFSVQSLNLNQTSTQEQYGTALGLDPWYSLMFSPTARYIAVLEGPSKPGPQSKMYQERHVLVFEDRSEAWEAPAFQVLAREYLTISPFIQTRFWAFHPTQPALAIACLGETNLWFFKHPVSWVKMPVGAPLDNLAFSNCGNYLHGIMCGQRRELRMINIQSIAFDNVEGRSQISMLRQLNDEGTVILQKSRDDGTIQSQCITRLPKSSSLKKSYATLVSKLSTFDSDPVQLVINKQMEDTYSSGSKTDMNLPLLVTRNAESIPRWTSKHKLTLEFPEDSPVPHRRRIT